MPLPILSVFDLAPRVDVGPDSATGPIADTVEFMRLRSQRWYIRDEPDDFADIAACSSTDLDPGEVLGNHSALVPALRMGDRRAIFETDPATGGEILWLLAADAWASVRDGQVRRHHPDLSQTMPIAALHPRWGEALNY